MPQNRSITLGVIVGNRNFFPDTLVTQGRHDILEILAERGIEPVILDESAGVFRLFFVFGLANPAQVRFLRFPYQQITATTEAIDDPQSRYYNRIVDRAAIADPDWSSSESMLRVGGPYRCGIMIEHNWRPRPGLGSCIFLHVWDSARRGTAGCIAVSSAHLEQLLHWIDAQNNPLIFQLPLPEYFLLRRSWELP
jgi:hypothetical protein